MRPRKGREPADVSTTAPVESPAPSGSVENAEKASSPDTVVSSLVESVEAEKSAKDQDASVGEQSAVVKGASEAPESESAVQSSSTEEKETCSVCYCVSGAKSSDVLRVCGGCKVAVHSSCYDAVSPSQEAVNEALQSGDTKDPLQWRCDCCRHQVSPQETRCEYCGKVGGGNAMRVVDMKKSAAFWSQYTKFEDETSSLTLKEGVQHFGHVLCINWDPRRLAAEVEKERKICSAEQETKPKPSPTLAADAAGTDSGETEEPDAEDAEEEELHWSDTLVNEPLPLAECCFCHSCAGIRIQCRRVSCARYFHAMCAQQGSGHVELRTTGFLQFHAYCDRHRDSTQDMGDFIAKLVTRHMRLLVGRDESYRLHTLAKRWQSYASAGAVLRYLASLFVGYCNKGLKTCKNTPPEYKMKQLQALQYFLNYVPQLEKVYALPETPAREFVDDSKLFRRLEKAFNPPKYLAKYPGPFSQQYTCDVCLDPFHERQHLFYCCAEDDKAVPHVQHWRCTKRRSNVRERERYLANGGSSKKKRKAISIVQDGVRKDITIPKGLQSMSDDIICGVCRAPVDARGLIASRKEAKRQDFDKKESRFVQNGCYINPFGSKVCAGFAQSVRPVASANASRRPLAKSSDIKTNGSLALHSTTSPQELGPPKMDRVNVQRTTRWLACVGQIIRLAGAPRPKAIVASAPTTANTTTKLTSPSAPVPSPAPASIPRAAASSPAHALSSAPALASAPGPSAPSTTAALTVASGSTPTIAPVVTSTPSFASKTITSSTNGLPIGQSKPDPKAEKTAPQTTDASSDAATLKPKSESLVTSAMQAYFDEAIRLVRPYDPYALSKLQTAHTMLVRRSGPGVAVLRMVTQEYTRFVYIKHTRAVEKARAQKRKRAEHEAQEHRERERKRVSREAEQALKSQMLAMRNKQRQHLKATSSKQTT